MQATLDAWRRQPEEKKTRKRLRQRDDDLEPPSPRPHRDRVFSSSLVSSLSSSIEEFSNDPIDSYSQISHGSPASPSPVAPSAAPLSPLPFPSSHSFLSVGLHYWPLARSRINAIAHNHIISELYANVNILPWQFSPILSSRPSAPVSRVHPPFVSCVEFDFYGSLLASSSTNGIVRIYDFDVLLSKSIAQRHAINRHNRTTSSSSSVLSGLGPLVVDGDRKSGSAHYNPDIVGELNIPHRVDCLRWNPIMDTHIAVSGSKWNYIQIFDLNASSSGRPIVSAQPGTAGIIDFAYFPDNRNLLASVTRTSQLCMFDLRTKKSLGAWTSAGRSHFGHAELWNNVNLPVSLCINATGDTIYVAKEKGNIEVWDTRINRPSEARTIYLNDYFTNRPPLFGGEKNARYLTSAQLDSFSYNQFVFQASDELVGYVDLLNGNAAILEDKSLETAEVDEFLYVVRKAVTFMPAANSSHTPFRCGQVAGGSPSVVAHCNSRNQQLRFTRVAHYHDNRHRNKEQLRDRKQAQRQRERKARQQKRIREVLEKRQNEEYSHHLLSNAEPPPLAGADCDALVREALLEAEQTINEIELYQPPPSPTLRDQFTLSSDSDGDSDGEPADLAAPPASARPLRNFRLPAGAVNLSAHPTLHFLACGLTNNQIAVCGAQGRTENEDQEEDGQQQENTQDGQDEGHAEADPIVVE